MASESIHSLSIPAHSTRSSPSIHVVYRILVETQSGTYEIHRRHRQFVALDSALRSSSPIAPPAFPDYSSFVPTYLQGSSSSEDGEGRNSPFNIQGPLYGFLEDGFLNKRRKALERWLRAMAVDGGKNAGVWTGNEAWKEFFKQDGDVEALDPGVGQLNLAAEPDEPVGERKSLPFRGANSYYLWALNQPDRGQVLDAFKGAGITVIRIFICHVNANNKGSNCPNVPDLEPYQLGQYDDTILQKIDQLMLECSQRNLKLIIACHDRYALGFWDTDQYALSYGIVRQGSSGAQQVVDARTFYVNNDCMRSFDARVDHIMAHKNTLMDNVAWGANPGGVIYAIEPENEPYGHMGYVPSSSWLNDRAGRIREGFVGDNHGILVANGGGVDIPTSLDNAMLTHPNVDVVCVHTYDTNIWSWIQQVSSARDRLGSPNKRIIVEEWGAKGGSKYQLVYSFLEACYDYNLAPMIWQVVKPGKGTSDFEIWTSDSDGAWWAYTHSPTGNRVPAPDEPIPEPTPEEGPPAPEA